MTLFLCSYINFRQSEAFMGTFFSSHSHLLLIYIWQWNWFSVYSYNPFTWPNKHLYLLLELICYIFGHIIFFKCFHICLHMLWQWYISKFWHRTISKKVVLTLLLCSYINCRQFEAFLGTFVSSHSQLLLIYIW